MNSSNSLGNKFLQGICYALLVCHQAAYSEIPLIAQWIWLNKNDVTSYNQAIVARKIIRLDAVGHAEVRITADSYYRLCINGHWISDGPCRSWPEHFQYDVLDVTPYLHAGDNEIKVIARYYGCGDFHHVPQQAGLLVQLDLTLNNGQTQSIISDNSWQVSRLKALIQNTPKICIQMEPAEMYDARLEDELSWTPSCVLYDTYEGPWHNLAPRDVKLLSCEPIMVKKFVGACIVQCNGLDFCLPAARLANPGLIEANICTSSACGMATLLVNEKDCTVQTDNVQMSFSIDGKQEPTGIFKLEPGTHLVLAFVNNPLGMAKEKSFRFINPHGFKLVNLIDEHCENPWCLLLFNEFSITNDDPRSAEFQAEDAEFMGKIIGYSTTIKQLLTTKNSADFQNVLKKRAALMPSAQMFVQDSYWQFAHREVVGDAHELVQNPEALISDTQHMTTILPSPVGDVELLYDLGEQHCGYWSFELIADAGLTVDIAAVEYITPEGRIQHTRSNRNSLRYITKQGLNAFTSFKRRSGRYIFITFRNQKTPVHVRHFNIIESTYPITQIGNFICSDNRLNEIWKISTATLKLCMEDTFTDCPLYEQTAWVGDARNEALFAYSLFGATDLGLRAIKLAAQSLELFPITGCQVPSSARVLLPAWSFLWGISTWDYYWYTGDKEFLARMWPSIIKNIEGAERYVNEQGLFQAPFWNMFDWTGADQQHKTVMHNSMFLVGALGCAIAQAELLGYTTELAWLSALRAKMVAGINRLWDCQKRSYPDSIHEDGGVSPSTCQHTSFLSILYDIIEQPHMIDAVNNLINPPTDMIRIGSPFAAHYLFETYEKLGLEQEIIKKIYNDYVPMLQAGATSCWESFPEGTTGRNGFPTRSHCHGWSAAPCYFLPRIILGIKPLVPGGTIIQISPKICNLTWARATVSTINGPVSAAWTLEGNTLSIDCNAPVGTQLKFVNNDALAGKRIVFNGTLIEH